jgi:hypothetical protein
MSSRYLLIGSLSLTLWACGPPPPEEHAGGGPTTHVDELPPPLGSSRTDRRNDGEGQLYGPDPMWCGSPDDCRLPEYEDELVPGRYDCQDNVCLFYPDEGVPDAG